MPSADPMVDQRPDQDVGEVSRLSKDSAFDSGDERCSRELGGVSVLVGTIGALDVGNAGVEGCPGDVAWFETQAAVALFFVLSLSDCALRQVILNHLPIELDMAGRQRHSESVS